MGIVNATPDSFSGDGVGGDVDAAVAQALRFQAEGADIIDIGGESTRPPSLYTGAEPVPVAEELRRIIPVIEALEDVLSIPISVDTHKVEVAREALAAGAGMVNDIWGLRRDDAMAGIIADTGVPVVLMHNQSHTRYTDLLPGVIDRLRQMRDHAISAGIEPKNIILDPGFGFGKNAEQNLALLRRLGELRSLGAPLLVGMSRKSTIGYVLDLPVDERIEGTAATVALSVAYGADIVRVHDVKYMARVARMSDAVVRGWHAPSAPRSKSAPTTNHIAERTPNAP